MGILRLFAWNIVHLCNKPFSDLYCHALLEYLGDNLKKLYYTLQENSDHIVAAIISRTFFSYLLLSIGSNLENAVNIVYEIRNSAFNISTND